MEMQQSNRVSTIMMVRGGQCQRVGPSPVMRLTQVIKQPSSSPPPPSPSPGAMYGDFSQISPSSVNSDHGTLSPSPVTMYDHGQFSPSPAYIDHGQFSPYSNQGQLSPSVYSNHGQPSPYNDPGQLSPSVYSDQGYGQQSPAMHSEQSQHSPMPVITIQVINQPSLSPPPLLPVSPGHNLIDTEQNNVPKPPALKKTKMCQVCKENSASHLHYGGRSCLSCKAFFRRAVTSSKKERVCKFRKVPDPDALCTVKKCASCRFKRCKENGMLEQLVLSGSKDALKHVGRVNKDTLEKLKQMAEKKGLEVDEEKKKDEGDKENYSLWDDMNLVIDMNTDLNTIEPSLAASPGVDLILEDTEAHFISSLRAQFSEGLGLSIFVPGEFTARDLLAPEPEYPHALVFTYLQDYVVQLVLLFLKHNPNFQAHSWHSQSKLLKKNLPEISFIFLSMFFNQHRQTFQWSLCSEDFNSIRAVRRSITSSDVEISESVISSHFGPTATKYVFKVANKLAELPKSVLLLLMLVSVFTREDLHLDKQDRVDKERDEYLKKIFCHLQAKVGQREAGFTLSKIHNILQYLKDCSESIRECQVDCVNM